MPIDQHAPAARRAVIVACSAALAVTMTGCNLNWDSISALEAWVERGVAPAALIGTDANAKANAGGRTRPLCE